jgi:hypothetical protein
LLASEAAPPTSGRPIDTPACTLSVTVASTDADFLRCTLPHIARASRFPFAHRMVLADLEPASGNFVRRPPGSAERLRALLDEFQTAGVIDEWIAVEPDDARMRDAWQGRLARRASHPRDYRGSPIASYLLSFALCRTPYLAHVDADMLIHQPAEEPSWVERGIELLRAHADVGVVLPLSGPPRPDGVVHSRKRYARDPRGFLRFGAFTSRLFLAERARIEALHPLDSRWPWTTPPGRRLTNLVRRARGQSTLPTWERMMERAFRTRRLVRADLLGGAWSLHPHARGPEFERLLPRIVEDVEAGRFPSEQAGHYNMRLELWRERYRMS